MPGDQSSARRGLCHSSDSAGATFSGTGPRRGRTWGYLDTAQPSPMSSRSTGRSVGRQRPSMKPTRGFLGAASAAGAIGPPLVGPVAGPRSSPGRTRLGITTPPSPSGPRGYVPMTDIDLARRGSPRTMRCGPGLVGAGGSTPASGPGPPTPAPTATPVLRTDRGARCPDPPSASSDARNPQRSRQDHDNGRPRIRPGLNVTRAETGTEHRRWRHAVELPADAGRRPPGRASFRSAWRLASPATQSKSPGAGR
jgi:hypothetical protein